MFKYLNLRIVLNALVFVLIIYFAIDVKERFQKFDKGYLTLTQKIYELKLSDHSVLDILKESIIHLQFNNDRIINTLNNHEIIVQNLLALEKNYPMYKKSFDVLNKHKLLFKQTKNDIYDFMQYNAKISNSLLYLENELTKLDTYEINFRNRLTKAISKLMNVKSDFRNDLYLEIEDIKFFDNYTTNKEHIKLTIAHIKLLQKEIPKFKNVFKTVENSKLFKIVNEFEDSLKQESDKINNKLQTHFLILVVILTLVSFSIIILMIKSKRDDQKLLKLAKENEKSLKYDSLTNVRTRSAFYEYIKIKDKTKITVLLIDINKFAKINTIVGYKGGDYILKEVAQILKKYGLTFRVSSDRFLLIPNVSDAFKEAFKISQEVSSHKYNYDDFELPISINIGISNIEPFVKTAELALFKAKESNENISFYSKSMDDSETTKYNIDMLKKVNKALSEDNIRPFFQPLVCLKSKKIIKYESLVRLIDDNKPLSPYFFLDITKGSKTYQSITKTVINKSIEFIKKHKTGVSINVSFEDIIDQTTISFINYLLIKNKEIAPLITFELLESEHIDSFEIVENFIKMVKSYGCLIAIDDFGSGYSNFEYLFKLEPDILKIDGSLIKDIDKNEKSKIIVESILYLTKKSNIKTVAEFVDSEDIDKIITQLGVDYGQGYYYSKPKDLLGDIEY